jgi:ribosomal protein L16 Arg81 hydroxylase
VSGRVVFAENIAARIRRINNEEVVALRLVGIEDLVGSTEAFLSDHFGRQPMLRVGALSDQPAVLLSSDQLLHDLAALESFQASYLRMVKGGKVIPHSRVTRKVMHPGRPLAEILDPGLVEEQFHSGTTLIYNYLNHHLPAMRRLSRIVMDTFGCESEAAAFLTPPRSSGLAPHTDPVDVFVIHLEGTKTWRVWERSPTGMPAGDLETPALEATLCPGDVLYIPTNTPHVAVSLDTRALHISLSVEPRRWRDVIRDCVDGVLSDDRFQGVTYLGQAAPSLRSDLAERFELLAQRVAGLDPVSEAARLTART